MKLNLRIAFHYANIWFQQAKASNCIEETYRDVVLLKKIIKQNPKIIQVLQNPSIPGAKKQDIFSKAVAPHVHPLTSTFFGLLISKRREAYFGVIIKQILEHYNAHHQIQVARVTTAFKLPPALVTRIENMVRNMQACKSVFLKQRVDPSLLGGFILKVGDQQLDHSLAHKLTMLKNSF